MFALYNLSTGLIVSYHSEIPIAGEGESYGMVSTENDVLLYDTYVRQLTYDEAEHAYRITAEASYKKVT